jgi:N-acetylmuramoyl-L-alanine amidase
VRTPRRRTAATLLVALLTACGADAPSPSSSTPPTVAPTSPTAVPSPSPGTVEPAPGSESAIYGPNPGAIVVAIDAGHGGCLDWGVPDPSQRGPAFAEKTMTLGIAQRLRDLLEADGIAVVMVRDADVALAGDDEPDHGCSGPAWRDVDGDGQAGFEATGRVRTRDELQARIDLANLSEADAFVSIHINSLTQNGVVFDLAATQSFYDDETPWGPDRSAALGTSLQDGVVAALDPIAGYDRQDRGTEAVAYYVISRQWQDGDTCETASDTWCKPHRALEMPGALSEVGSITLRAEQDLLVSDAGQQAVASGLFDGLAAYFGGREVAGRIGLADRPAGAPPAAVTGRGPLFWAPTIDAAAPVRLRITNNGTEPWPEGAHLVAGWQPTDQPYLASAPEAVEPVGSILPAMAPGESVTLEVAMPDAERGRSVAWVTLELPSGQLLADLGSPALQVATGAP